MHIYSRFIVSRVEYEPSLHLGSLRRKLAAASLCAAVLGACLEPDTSDEREVVSALTGDGPEHVVSGHVVSASPTNSGGMRALMGQGTSYQGTSYQGTSYQGTSYQGTSYQGTSYQGASYGGSALLEGAIVDTALVAWKSAESAKWEQRFPDRICTWDVSRTISYGCRSVDLNASPSPLAGSTWLATFQRLDGTAFKGTVKINAAYADTSRAMHPLNGSGSTCALDHTSSPGGCDPDPSRDHAAILISFRCVAA